MTTGSPLKRHLGLGAVAAIVVGNMLGSGVFFTPGELAAVADHAWQVHFIWALSGLITLCGALTLAELCAWVPEAGASYHVITRGFGPFWGFLLVWLELWVSGPGAIASIAIALGEFLHRGTGGFGPVAWGAAGIVFFALVNLAGVQWGGRTQIVPRMDEVPGFCSMSLLIDRKTGHGSLTAVYADRAAMDAARDTMTRMRDEFTGQRGIMVTDEADFEVVMHSLRVPELV